MFTKIKNWFGLKFADSLFVQLLNWLQSRHPVFFLSIIAVCVGLHETAEGWLLALQTACETDGICDTELETLVATVLKYTTIVVGILSGSKKLSSITDFLNVKEAVK